MPRSLDHALLDACSSTAFVHLLQNRQGQLMFPDYDLYSVCNVMPTALYAMGSRDPAVLRQALQTRTPDAVRDRLLNAVPEGQPPRHVLMLMLDGLGFWHFLEAAATVNFLPANAALLPFSSCYPTVTTVALSCMWSWTPPAVHGITGRPLYLKEVDSLVDPKSGRTVPGNEPLPNGLLLELTNVQDRHRYFEQLGFTVNMYAAESYSGFRRLVYGEGTRTRVMQDDMADINKIRLEQFASKGSEEVDRDLELLQQALKDFHAEPGRSFSFVNLEAPNIVGHRHPVNSHLFLDSMTRLLAGVQQLVRESGLKDLLVMGIGDHGATPVSLSNNLDVSQFLARWKHVMTAPAVNHHRVLHLYVRPEDRAELQEAVEREFGGLVRCLAKDEALFQSIYGAGNGERDYTARCGDLLLFNLGAGLFWTDHDPAYKRAKMSDHGGLSVEELLVPFFAFHSR